MGAVHQYCGCKEKPEEVILFQEKKLSRREQKFSTNKNPDNTGNDNQKGLSSGTKLFSAEELKLLDNSALKIQKNWKAIKLKSKIKESENITDSNNQNPKQRILDKFKNIINLININIEKQGHFIPNQEFLNKMPEQIFETYKKFFKKEPLNMSFSPANTYRIRRSSLFCYGDQFIYKGQWTPSGEKDGFGVLLGNDFLVQGFWIKNHLYYGMKIFLNGDYYIGQIKNFKANGDGKFYKQNDDLVYEGNFKDDKFHGMGKIKLNLVDPTGFFRSLIGVWSEADKNGKRDYNDINNNSHNNQNKLNGKSKTENLKRHSSIYNFKGAYYKGQFYENTIHGKGKLHIQNYLKYEGDFIDGKFNGDGKLIFFFTETTSNRNERNSINNNHNKNSRQEENNKKQLQNTDQSNNNNKLNKSLKKTNSIKLENDEYTGEFINNVIFGRGIYVWKSGEYFEGTFAENKKENWGTLTFPSGVGFETCWKNDLPGDKVIVFDEDGKLLSNEFYKLKSPNAINSDGYAPRAREDGKDSVEAKYFDIPKQKHLVIPEFYYDYPEKDY